MRDALEKIARHELVGAQRVLVVNAPPFAHGSVTAVPSLDRLPDAAPDGGRFEGVLWGCERELAAGLRRLRSWLLPGARVIVAIAFRRSPWEIVLDVVHGERARRPSFEELCEVLLLQGWEGPRVLADSAGWAIAAASAPQKPDPLDEVFTQLG